MAWSLTSLHQPNADPSFLLWCSGKYQTHDEHFHIKPWVLITTAFKYLAKLRPVAYIALSPNIATAVGPIIGGAFTSYLSWRWIFWFLTIISGLCLVFVALLLPETARSIVGDGSGRVSGLRRTFASYLRVSRQSSSRDKHEESGSEPTVSSEFHTSRRLRLPNPLKTLKLLWAKDTALITLIFGIFYMNLSSLQASTSTLFITTYEISGLQLGLIYLPSGIGSCIGAYCAGKFTVCIVPHIRLTNEQYSV